ncbi:PaaI family thioesterase [Conexibacter sp. SYSU D00693]|uniref:PaaI family thioesterase n=1 Tax=Conexibacter sp. SYSU D00693 TaxID=2812560 RepID=UPI00196AFB37|nr:PaaI family thioesterase [Conexibacter sp. SYSU D00693]
MSSTTTPSRRDVIAAFIPHSPLARLLGIRVGELGDDRARLELPFRDELATMADVVHGGAVATLADTAAMAAAWSIDEPAPANPAGATVSLHTDFLAPARGDLVADAEVLRRGGRLSFVRVEVRDAQEALVATASATYRLGG